MIRTRRATLLALALSAQALTACFDSTGGEPGLTRPTLVAVTPDDFLGEVACGSEAGAMQRYVATLVDVTDDGTGVVDEFARSSGAVPCDQTVAFGNVVPGHRYVADVQGYDRSDIHPLGTPAGYDSPFGNGVPVMVDAEGSLVEPRWTTSCGRGGGSGASGPVVSARYFTVHVQGCAPLEQSGREGLAGIAVDIDDALAGLDCSQVERFRVAPDDGALAVKEAACGERVQYFGIEPGALYQFSVLGFAAGSTLPAWGTRCDAQARTGTTVRAACGALGSVGGVRLDVPALLGEMGQSCGGDGVVSLTATLLGPGEPIAKTLQGSECRGSLQWSELEPGQVELTVESVLFGGAAGPSASCEALVLPGQVTQADCVTSP